MRNILLFSVLALGVSGCSTASIKSSKIQDVHFDDLATISIGKTKSDFILNKFGEPPMQMASRKEGAVSWLYSSRDNPQKQRAAFVFDAKSNVLKEINWMVYENDSESEPSNVFLKYKEAQFKAHEVQWQQTDWISSRTTYVDNNKGIAIVTRTDRPDVVALISLAAPGSIEERDGFLGTLKNKQDDWKIIVDRRKPDRSSASLE